MENVDAKNRAWDQVDEDISVKISRGLSRRPFAHIEIIFYSNVNLIQGDWLRT